MNAAPRDVGCERDTFLSAFAADNLSTQVGFAVMGGVFGEGSTSWAIALIGAVIVGVGLPQLCVERDLIDQHFQEKIGADSITPIPSRASIACSRQPAASFVRNRIGEPSLLIRRALRRSALSTLLPRWWQYRSASGHSSKIREVLRPF